MNTKAFKEAGGETETTSQAIKFLTDYADTHLKTVGLKNNSGETLKSLSDMLIKKGSSFGEEISELDEAALNESAARTGMYEHKPSEG
jgi:endonuclease III